MNTTSDFWTHGQSTLEKGEVLMHSFSYNCKQSILKPVQLLRAYSVDGSIVSGRTSEMDNDYENFVITYCNKDRKPVVEKVKRSKHSESVTNSIYLDSLEILWENPYSQNSFNDQQVAIATLVEESIKGNIYSVEQGIYDFLTINAMKQSHINGAILSVNN